MLIAGKAANAHGVPVVLDPVGAGATRYRTDTARRILEQVKVSVLRGNQGEIATLVGVDAEVRGVESIGAGSERAEIARAAARKLDLVASVTGPVDQVSDGERVLAVANGHELLASVTGTGCMSSAITGCFLAAKRDAPLEAAAEALASFGVAAEDAARGAAGPGLFPRRSLRRTCGARSGHARLAYADLVKLHAIVDELETARLAVDGGATVVQWRLKDVAARRRRRARPGDAEPLRALRRDVRRQRRRRGCADARRRRRPPRPRRRRSGAREGQRPLARPLRFDTRGGT